MHLNTLQEMSNRITGDVLGWFDGLGKTAAGFSVYAAATDSSTLAIGSAIVAVIATVVPHLVRAYHDYRTVKRIEDDADKIQLELTQLRRLRIQHETKIVLLEEHVEELKKMACTLATHVEQCPRFSSAHPNVNVPEPVQHPCPPHKPAK